ncbi:MAG: AsmA-like C-terminal region-containing protein [Candidatus Omnitrophota bacterium]
MKKILILAAAIVFAIVIIVIYYFNAVFLPKTLKTIVNEKARAFLNRTVTYDTIEYVFGQGLVVHGVRISQRENQNETLFKAERISSNIQVIPFLKSRKIILPQMHIEGFETSLTRLDETTWNISDLFLPQYASNKKSFDILIGAVKLSRGKISLQDRLQVFEPKTIQVELMEAAINLPDKINFSLKAQKDAGSAADISGAYMILKKSFELKGQLTNIDLIKDIKPFIGADIPVHHAILTSADLKASYKEGAVEIHGNVSADTSLTLVDLKVQGLLELSGAHFSWGKDHLYLDIDRFTTPDSLMTFKKGIRYSGALAIDTIKLTREAGSFSVEGNITASPTLLKINSIQILAKELIAKGKLAKKPAADGKADEITCLASLSGPAVTFDFGNVAVTGDLDIPDFRLSAEKENTNAATPVILKNAFLKGPNSVFVKGDLKSDLLSLTVTKDLITIWGKADTELLSFELSQNRKGSVVPTNTTYRILFDRTKLDGLTYEVITDLYKGKVHNFMPQFETIDDVRGRVRLVNDKIELNELLVSFKDTIISANGSLRTFNKFIADLAIEAKGINIGDWDPLLKPYLSSYGITIGGLTDVHLIVRGPLVPPGKPQILFETKFKNAQAAWARFPLSSLSNIEGYVKYEADSLLWEDLKFKFQEDIYTSSGNIRQFDKPLITIKLQKPDLFLSVIAQSTGQFYELSRIDLKTKLSSLAIMGKTSIDFENPFVELSARGHVFLSDLKRIPALKPVLDEWEVWGKANVDIMYTGSPTNPQNATFSLDYQSEQTSVKKIKFDNLFLKVAQLEPGQETFNAATSFYQGKLSTAGQLKMKDDYPLTIKIEGADIDIESLRNDLPFKNNKKIGGSLTTDLYLEGPLKNKEKMRGQGQVTVRNGFFAKSNLLKGVLMLILNDYEDTVFTDGKAKLFLRDNRLKLQDIYLKSTDVDLTGFGTIDINKNLDFTITPNFKNSLSIKTSLLKSGAEDIIEKYLSIRVTGTLENPKYSSGVDSSSVVQDAADAISNGMQNIIQGLGF